MEQDLSRKWQQIVGRFKKLVASQPHEVCAVSSDDELTFEQLDSRSERIAEELSLRGLTDGSFAALVALNGFGFVGMFLALIKIGAVVALVSPRYRLHEWTRISEHAALDFVVGDQQTCAELVDLGLLTSIGGRNQHPADEPIGILRPIEIGADASAPGADIALIKFTSGTTGIPKAVTLTEENLIHEAENVAAALSISQDDSILAVSPLCHSYAFDLGLLPMLTVGSKLVIEDQFVPRRLVKMTGRSEVDILLGVPAVYRTLLETRGVERGAFENCRYLLSCTEPLEATAIVKFRQKFGADICQHYGSSESGAAVLHDLARISGLESSVGKGLKGVEVTVRNERGDRLGDGEAGEVYIESRAVSPGYLYSDPNSASVLLNGTYRTGDIGYLNEDGFLFLTGRTDSLLNVGGHKVAAREIAEALLKHPLIESADVTTEDAAEGGKQIVAKVRTTHIVGADEILLHCRGLLADYKIPRRIEFS